MRTLSLFEAPLETPIASGPSRAINSGCRRCALGGTGTNTCLPAEGVEGIERARGRALIIGEWPTADEDRTGRPMTGVSGRAVRRVVEQYWSGDYVLDYGVRCHPRRLDAKYLPTAQEQCAAYLRETFVQSQPDRILVLGHMAGRSVLGRYVPPFDTRKNYTWIRHPSGKHVPVFVLMHVTQSLQNRHLQRMLEEDCQWALTVDLATLMPPPDDVQFHIVEDDADARAAADALLEHDWAAYDCETGGRQFSDFFRIVAVSLAPATGDTAYVWGRQALTNPRALAVLRELMEDPVLGKIGHNEKYDKLSMRAAFGIRVQGSVLDTQLSRHLELPGCNAELDVAAELVGMGGYWQVFEKRHLDRARLTISRARTKSKGGKQLRLLCEDEVLVAALEHPHEDVLAYAYALIPSPHLERYNACDAITTARLARSRCGFELVTRFPPARHMWRTLVRHTTNAVEQIEAWGIGVNRDAMDNFNRYIAERTAEVERRLALYRFSPTSPQQVAELLFDKLGLHNPHAPKSRSTDKKALFAMKAMHPVVADLREHRRLAKLKTAYGGLEAFIRSDDRIHPSFKIDGTGTGRLSCVDPALHTLPRNKDGEGHTEGRLIRALFGVPPGYKLLALDQSQIELRAAAALSGDNKMREIFSAGARVDFHLQAAKLIAPTYWRISPDDVTSAHRSETKSFVFGLMYGMTDHGLAARLNCSLVEAARLRAAILGQFHGLAAWIETCVREARRSGLIVTPWLGQPGRIRDLHPIANRDSGDRFDAVNKALMAAKRTAENGSFNTPCQTLASDTVLHALATRIVPWLQRDSSIDAKVVMTVHDSVLFQVREDHLERCARTVMPMMTDYDFNAIPLVVDCEYGDDWGHLEKASELLIAA